MLNICLVCSGDSVAVEYEGEGLQVVVCRNCGHMRASHPPLVQETDYHVHTPNSERFLSSLRATRERQAREILARMKRQVETAGPWLDFGCGRGWFLATARTGGTPYPQGFDASEVSRTWLKENGFDVAEPSAFDNRWPEWSSLDPPPKVLSLLDVIEHFENPLAVVQRILKELPSLRWLVIKVPVSDGVLFQIARVVRASSPSLYLQLFQYGTFPPHYHYFSRQSFRSLLGLLPLELADFWTDRDVDNLFHRVPALEKFPGGCLAARVVGLFPSDSALAIAKVKR